MLSWTSWKRLPSPMQKKALSLSYLACDCLLLVTISTLKIIVVGRATPNVHVSMNEGVKLGNWHNWSSRYYQKMSFECTIMSFHLKLNIYFILTEWNIITNAKFQISAHYCPFKRHFLIIPALSSDISLFATKNFSIFLLLLLKSW